MSDSNKLLYEIEEEYFSILEDFYGPFYAEYKDSGLKKEVYISKFLGNHKYIMLPKNEDDLLYRRRELKNILYAF